MNSNNLIETIRSNVKLGKETEVMDKVGTANKVKLKVVDINNKYVFVKWSDRKAVKFNIGYAERNWRVA